MGRNDYPSNTQERAPKAGMMRKLGKAMLGGNIAAPVEAFTGGKGSVAELGASLPTIKPKVETRVWSNLIHPESTPGPEGATRALSAVVLAGDTALAITRRQRSIGAEPTVEIVELPYGEHAADNMQTGKLLASVTPRDLRRPASDGIITPWQTLNFGRSNENGTIKIGDDPELSRNHLAITVGADGNVSVTDLGSTNGVRIIDTAAMYNGAENPALVSLNARLHDLASAAEWSGQYSQHIATVPQ